MMYAITVDDEHPNHFLLKKFLEEKKHITVLEQFSNPLNVLEKAAILQPDVAFIDIEMPEINGLELAERLQYICPSIQIVFVTAFSHYAVDAFHINAIDYLLKPIEKSEISRVIKKLQSNREQQRIVDGVLEGLLEGVIVEPCRINTLGCFNVYGPHSKMPIQWMTSKVEELFAYLLLNIGRSVGNEELYDVLWPDTEHENGMMNLYSTVYRLRKTLLKEMIPIEVSRQKYGYQIDADGLFLDFKVFEKLTMTLENSDVSNDTETDIEAMVDAASLYKGEFFGARAYLWSASYGEFINRTYRLLSYRLVNYFLSLNRIDKAVVYLKNILYYFPDEEQACLQLMTAYNLLGDFKEMAKCYITYLDYLHNELNVEPSHQIESCYKTLSEKSTTNPS